MSQFSIWLEVFLLNSFFLWYFRAKVWKRLRTCAIYVPQGGCEESIIFVKFLKYFYSHHLCPDWCHSLPPPLIGPLVAEKRCCWTFYVSVSFTEVTENVVPHFQNPHDQTVLIILILAPYAYPELSNCHLKVQKLLARSSLASKTGRNLLDHFYGFKWWVLASE